MQNKNEENTMLKEWAKSAIFLLLISINLYSWSPYNKKIWTVSYSFVTGGIAGVVLIICYLMVDRYKNKYVTLFF